MFMGHIQLNALSQMVRDYIKIHSRTEFTVRYATLCNHSSMCVLILVYVVYVDISLLSSPPCGLLKNAEP